MDMPFYATLFIAVGLAMDAFAVSLGIGTNGHARTFRPIFRLSFHFGLFQGLMALLGWLAGSSIARFISTWDHWLAFGLLAFVGIRMVKSGFNKEEDPNKNDPSRGGTLLLLCVATSIDAMAVGFGMALVGANILAPSLVIGVVTLGLSLFGLFAGAFLGKKFGKRMEIIGGLILIGIGLNIMFSHLLGG
jgi:manganese efflux pump family protein